LNWPAIRVVPFAKSECPPTEGSGPPLFTWRDYYTFRNSVLRVLGKYGTVGPSGEMPILETWEESEDAWKSGNQNPDFFVVSDMYNSRFRWNRVEASPWLVNGDLLTELVAMLFNWPEWCIYLALIDGGLTIFRNRILYEGTLFEGCASIGDLAARCASKKPRV
jgi:hypothetical protein